MQIDPTTMLFQDLTDQEATELQRYGEQLMLRGIVPNPQPEMITEWFVKCGLDQRQGLLVVSTVLPSRIFYSLLLRTQTILNEVVE